MPDNKINVIAGIVTEITEIDAEIQAALEKVIELRQKRKLFHLALSCLRDGDVPDEVELYDLKQQIKASCRSTPSVPPAPGKPEEESSKQKKKQFEELLQVISAWSYDIMAPWSAREAVKQARQVLPWFARLSSSAAESRIRRVIRKLLASRKLEQSDNYPDSGDRYD